MDCLEFNRMLDNYENLTTKEKFLLSNHADSCDKCRSELDFYKSVILASQSLPAMEPPADFLDMVNSRIDSLPKHTGRLDKVFCNIRLYSKQYATLAACLAVGLAVGLNSKIINEKLTDSDTDGVIRTTVDVTENEGSLSDYEIEEDNAENEPVATERVVAQRDAGEDNDAPAAFAPSAAAGPVMATSVPRKNADNVKATVKPYQTSAPRATSAPKASSRAASVPIVISAPRSNSVPRAVSTPIVTSAPAATPAPVVTDAPASEQPSNSKKNRYTIAHGNYRVPETASVTETTAEPQTAPDVEISGERYEIAMGAYEVSEEEKKALSLNKLVVNEGDIPRVIDCMNSSWVRSSTNGFTATSVAFANFLAKLDAEGIYYNYIQLSDTGSEVNFILLAN